jgi:hypothetical protein
MYEELLPIFRYFVHLFDVVVFGAIFVSPHAL